MIRTASYVIGAFIFSWLILFGALGQYSAAGGGEAAFASVVPWILLASLGPLLSGLATVAYFDGRRAMIDLLRSLVRLRASAAAYIAALAIPFSAACLAAGASAALGYSMTPAPSEWAMYSGAFLLGVIPGLVGGPIGEELGWRGVLFPSLLSRMSPWLACLCLAPIWAAWHGPAFLMPEWRFGLSLPFFLSFYLPSVMGLSMFLGGVRLLSPNSLVPSMIGHSASNTAQGALILLGLGSGLSDEQTLLIGWFVAATMLLLGALCLRHALKRRRLCGREQS